MPQFEQFAVKTGPILRTRCGEYCLSGENLLQSLHLERRLWDIFTNWPIGRN